MRTKLVLAGKSKAEVKEGMKTAIEKKELPELEAGAMSYMMSKDAYLTDAGGHNMAHLMLYTPLMDGAVWGANLVDSSNKLSETFPGSPLLLAPLFKGNPEPIDVFLMAHWHVVRWNGGPNVGCCTRMERNTQSRARVFPRQCAPHSSGRSVMKTGFERAERTVSLCGRFLACRLAVAAVACSWTSASAGNSGACHQCALSKCMFRSRFLSIFDTVWRKPNGPINFQAPPGNTAPTSKRSGSSQSIGRTAFDWRAQEAKINRFDQFTTEIDGQQIYFIHQRSPRPDAVPLLLIHGWPGSIVEFLALVEPLTQPKDSHARHSTSSFPRFLALGSPDQPQLAAGAHSAWPRLWSF